MKEPWEMTDKELEEILREPAGHEDILDEVYDEVERRQRDLEMMDWTEQDAMAAWDDRYQMWRNEY